MILRLPYWQDCPLSSHTILKYRRISCKDQDIDIIVLDDSDGFIELLGLMDSVTGTFHIDDDGSMNHAIHDGSCDDRITQVISQSFEVDIGGHDRGVFAVAGIDDFEKQ